MEELKVGIGAFWLYPQHHYHNEVEELKVGIGEWKIARPPQRLITLGLGSCVGIAFFDTRTSLGGLAHIMLPDSRQFQEITNRAKYADLAIPDMLEAMLKQGARRSSLVAKIAGGAQMFASADRRLLNLNIGQRNVEATVGVLKELGIPLLAQDTGGNYGRTMILDTGSGKVYIRAIGRPLKEI
ncbi:MAG: putative chemoreceptor glutamine deamidase CheD [Moorella sp. 60_41]|nr:MAG: putative chemoreceptor glutamine deamidase CheD [Moorella sp. 60_41]